MISQNIIRLKNEAVFRPPGTGARDGGAAIRLQLESGAATLWATVRYCGEQRSSGVRGSSVCSHCPGMTRAQQSGHLESYCCPVWGPSVLGRRWLRRS